MNQEEKLKQAFDRFSDRAPRLFRSPGRINLLGDHTDYNLGWAMPAAIDKYVYMAISSNHTDQCRVRAMDIDESYQFNLGYLGRNEAVNWPNYFIGLTALMREAGVDVRGFDCVFTSDIPVGAGLSSSAAICCSLAFALNELYEGMLPRERLVELAQETEHRFIGVNCGNMDQTASLFGREGQVLCFDCRSRQISYSTLALKGYELVVCDSKVKHTHATSGYNDRRYSCDQIIEFFQKRRAGVSSIRDISIDELQKFRQELGPFLYRRGVFVLTENQRVMDGVAMLASGNLRQFGRLMYASHQGLSSDYEVSCPEMDFLVDLTRDLSYVLGARMMGGGFGGCTINLVSVAEVNSFKTNLYEAYLKRFGRHCRFIPVSIAGGTSELRELDYAL